MKIRQLERNEVYCINRWEGYEDCEIYAICSSRNSMEKELNKLMEETNRKQIIEDEIEFTNIIQELDNCEYSINMVIKKLL